MRKTLKGFGIIEGLIVLVIVLLLVFSGWRLWDYHNRTSKKQPSGTSETAKTPLHAAFCLDNKTTLNTPVHNFLGPGNELITAFARLLVKGNGQFYTTSDGNVFNSNLHYKTVNETLPKTTHTLSDGACKS